MLRPLLRACLLGCIVAGFLAGGRRGRDGRGLRRTTVRASRYARLAIRVLGVRMVREGRRAQRPDGGILVVCNHVSWLDPLLLAATCPSVFVTSIETGEDPFLGRVCAAAGCVLMERRRRAGLRDEVDRLTALLRAGDLVVFPEATSGDGRRVLPFRPACFAAALAAPAPVQPLALEYIADRGRVPWHGDMTLLPHIARLLTLARIEARLRWLPPVAPAPDSCRKALAAAAHATVASALARTRRNGVGCEGPPPVDVTGRLAIMAA